jgi:hypothetical protein
VSCPLKSRPLSSINSVFWRVLVVCTTHALQYQVPCHLSIMFSGVSLSSTSHDLQYQGPCHLSAVFWRVLVVCTSHDLQYQGPCHLSIVFSGVSLSSVLVISCNVPVMYPCCILQSTGLMYFVFCHLHPFFPQPPRQCLAPNNHLSTLNLPYTVSPVRACLSI